MNATPESTAPPLGESLDASPMTRLHRRFWLPLDEVSGQSFAALAPTPAPP